MQESSSDPAKILALVESASNGDINAVRKLLKKVDPNERCAFGSIERHETLTPTHYPSAMDVMGTLRLDMQRRRRMTDAGMTTAQFNRSTAPFETDSALLPRRKVSTGWLKNSTSYKNLVATLSRSPRRRKQISESEFVADAGDAFTFDQESIMENNFSSKWICTPLIAAAKNGHVATVDLLLANGADINLPCCCNGTALYWAARFKRRDVVKRLCSDKAIEVNVQTRGAAETALIAAARHGHTKVSEELLMHPDIDPNAKTMKGQHTALHLAVQANHFSIVRDLVGNCSTLCNAKNEEGETALTLAARIEHDTGILSLLISHPRVDLGTKNVCGLRAVHLAAMDRNLLAVRLLLTVSQGVNPAQYVNEMCSLANGEPAAFLTKEIERLQSILTVNPKDDLVEHIEYYEINPKSPGSVLILNVHDFHEKVDLKNRDGSDRDVDRLEELFGDFLNFKVFVPKDEKGDRKRYFTAEDLEMSLEVFSKRRDHTSASMCVVVVMSHGKKDGKILDSEGKYIRVEEDVVGRFTAESCPALAGKPKFFLFQACRGINQDKQRRVVSSSNLTTDASSYVDSRQGLYSDMILAYASTPNFASYRDTEKGTIFIQSVCKVFREFAHKLDMATLLTMVMRDVDQYKYEDEEEMLHKQTACIEYRSFWKRLHLCPKESCI